MRRLIAITQLTLDGVMQAPGGLEEDSRGGFAYGGWAMAFGDEVLGQVITETITGDFDMLLGRRTYEIFAAYWPHHDDDPIGKAFNAARKYVASRSLAALDWAHSHAIAGDAVDGVRRLKTSEGPDLQVWGSGEFLQSLIAAGLVDEYRFWIVPVLLGKGRRLFTGEIPPGSLTLVGTRATSTGVLINTYRPAGALSPAPVESDPASPAELARRRRLAAES